MQHLFLLALLITTNCFSQNPDIVYENFSKAYEELSAEKLSILYTENATVLNLYDRENANSLNGSNEIKEHYKAFFSSIRKENQNLLLTFKIVTRRAKNDEIFDNGFYRLEIRTSNKPSQYIFGKFSTVLRSQNGEWKLITDATTNVDFTEYENALVATIPKRDELLHPQFYDDLLGDYLTENNDLIVIGRSQTRLYAFFENSNEFRGLNKQNATTWALGSTVISNENNQTFKFVENKINIYQNDILVSTANRKKFYETERVLYPNKDGTVLAGTLFIPHKANGKAIVLVHGSGPQDRNGYASIIRLLADNFARQGTTVLTYDKQGVGQSEGNSDYLSFSGLAEDALAGVKFLKTRNNLNLTKIGLGGSSQAGWIIAKAVEMNHQQIDFVLTIGAAGSGISVQKQNLYNTETLMRCMGKFNKTQIETAIKQQKLFFQYLTNPSSAKKLDDFTKKIENDTLIRNWLFPISKQIDLTNRNQWFTALEISFDPLEIWEKYNKPVFMLFSEFDDSTPSHSIKQKVDKLKNSHIQTVLLLNTQHIGLETNSICQNELSGLKKFNALFFRTINDWLQSF